MNDRFRDYLLFRVLIAAVISDPLARGHITLI